jgi:hypothetical protein
MPARIEPSRAKQYEVDREKERNEETREASKGKETKVGSVPATNGRLRNQIHTDDTVGTQFLLDDRVVSDRDPLTVNLGVTPLVDELLDSLDVWCTVMSDFARSGRNTHEEEGKGGKRNRTTHDVINSLFSSVLQQDRTERLLTRR